MTKLNKTEAKILDRLNKSGDKDYGVDSCESRREFQAALSLVKKGYLELVSLNPHSFLSTRRSIDGSYRRIHSNSLYAKVIKTK